MSRQNCECAYVLNTEDLLSCTQMSSTEVCCVVQVGYGLGEKKNCSRVWFWCSVICSAGQRATVQRESELGVRGPE